MVLAPNWGVIRGCSPDPSVQSTYQDVHQAVESGQGCPHDNPGVPELRTDHEGVLGLNTKWRNRTLQGIP